MRKFRTMETKKRLVFAADHAETGWTQESKKDYTRFKNALAYFITRWVEKGYISNHPF